MFIIESWGGGLRAGKNEKNEKRKKNRHVYFSKFIQLVEKNICIIKQMKTWKLHVCWNICFYCCHSVYLQKLFKALWYTFVYRKQETKTEKWKIEKMKSYIHMIELYSLDLNQCIYYKSNYNIKATFVWQIYFKCFHLVYIQKHVLAFLKHYDTLFNLNRMKHIFSTCCNRI